MKSLIQEEMAIKAKVDALMKKLEENKKSQELIEFKLNNKQESLVKKIDKLIQAKFVDWVKEGNEFYNTPEKLVGCIEEKWHEENNENLLTIKEGNKEIKEYSNKIKYFKSELEISKKNILKLKEAKKLVAQLKKSFKEK